MPYIQQIQREVFDEKIDSMRPPMDVGELNYVLTRIFLKYIEANGGLRYQRINDVVGAVECAKLEVYRRLAAKYEDSKILENGDVY